VLADGCRDKNASKSVSRKTVLSPILIRWIFPLAASRSNKRVEHDRYRADSIRDKVPLFLETDAGIGSSPEFNERSQN
jgi:hypothetical protein